MNKLVLKTTILKTLGVFLSFALSPLSANNSIAQGEAQARSDIEQQRKEMVDQTQKTIISEAVDAIAETKKAIDALLNGQEKEGFSTIEKATGKISILVARYPEKALLPVDFEVRVIDMALKEIPRIREVSHAAHRAVEYTNYPEARLLLDTLRSEIHIRTYQLPLAIYPAALQEAARLLEEKKTNEAVAILITALNTLVIMDKVIPLPLINARAFLLVAEKKYPQEKEVALKLLAKARYEIKRAKELGYTGMDAEYGALNHVIEDLEKQIKGNKSTAPELFTTLKNKMEAFLKHLSTKK